MNGQGVAGIWWIVVAPVGSSATQRSLPAAPTSVPTPSATPTSAPPAATRAPAPATPTASVPPPAATATTAPGADRDVAASAHADLHVHVWALNSTTPQAEDSRGSPACMKAAAPC